MTVYKGLTPTTNIYYGASKITNLYVGRGAGGINIPADMAASYFLLMMAR